MRSRLFIGIVAALLFAPPPVNPVLTGASPTSYRFTFPAPEHHWMQVEATFRDLDRMPLELRMSRSSPGRYSLHDFAKNVYDVEARDVNGATLRLTRPDPYGWTVPEHSAAVTVRYKVFGNRVDGTYLGIDTSHAHINMPAAIMWARGLDDRPSTLTFVQPAGARWQVATQLFAGSTPFEFTAPNLQYLMDSPTEFGPLSIRQFDVDGQAIRFAAHHTGTAAELDRFVIDVEKIVRQQGMVFGEFPKYEPGAYTFLADYLPYVNDDGMEHRNSTVVTSASSFALNRHGLLSTVSHEFFHGWNAERIRPRSLEPFDFERANLSGELWLAEGFTQYYGPLALSRAGLQPLAATLVTLRGFIAEATLNPGRQLRSAEEMSHMATFTDRATTLDPTNWGNTFISYYQHGGAIALALDLSLRQRSGGRTTLDDFMRAMWRAHGKRVGSQPGYVDQPYSRDDAQRRLAEVSDAAFAREFFVKYVHGRDVPDYTRLLSAAGLIVRKQSPGRSWWGNVHLEDRAGPRVASAPLSNTPAYQAGLDFGDQLKEVAGTRVSSSDEVMAALGRHKPGDVVAVAFVDRTGQARTGRVTLVEDPEMELVPVEATGGTLSEAQRTFRRAWLGA